MNGRKTKAEETDSDYPQMDNTQCTFSPELMSVLQELAASQSGVFTLQENHEPAKKPHRPSYRATVDPIKDMQDIVDAKNYFLSQSQYYTSSVTNIRNYALFVLGINCARRIGDLLNLTIGEILNEDGSFRPYLDIKSEQKTGKSARIPFNSDAKEALSLYIHALGAYSLSDYLFCSRKGENRPITTRSAWRIMKEMSRAVGLDKKGINVGTHSLRKTAACNMYRNTKDIETVAEALNHSSYKVTKRYIGITQDEVNRAIMDLHYPPATAK